MPLYDPNTVQWKKGNVVIHKADEKSPKMLMVVVGFTRQEGLVKTRYTSLVHKRTVWENDLKHLLDPSLFGLNPVWGLYIQEAQERIQSTWEQVRFWNNRYPPGTEVIVKGLTGIASAKTDSKAFMSEFGTAFVYLRGHIADDVQWLLKEIEPVTVQSPLDARAFNESTDHPSS